MGNSRRWRKAKPFYDRLIEIGYTSAYPWPNPATPPDDYAVANLGQMKNLFSFDLTTSTANDGILDWRANAAGLGPTNPATAAALATNGPPLSPAPVPVLAVPGAAGAKANS